VAAIPLPAVRGAMLAAATDHVPVLALIAHATARDVVDNGSIALMKALAARPNAHDLAARLVAGDDVLVPLRPLPEVLPVDGADVAATDG